MKNALSSNNIILIAPVLS